MRIIKRFLFWSLAAISIVVIGSLVTGNSHFLIALQKTYLSGQKGPSIDDFDKFHHRKINHATGKGFPRAANYLSALPAADEDFLDSIKTASFLILHNDSLLVETYFEGYNHESVTNSFSMAKSFVSMAVGVAIKNNLISSIDDFAYQYIPELKEKGITDVTIRHLLQMSSGIGFDENYKNPFGYQAKVYYGNDLIKNTLKFNQTYQAGTRWEYLGGNTILLAMIVEAASKQNLSDFFSENIWQKIDAESDAWWTLDKKEGVERASCCFYATTHDFARLGQLYLKQGVWNDVEVVPDWFVKESTRPVEILDKNGDTVLHYGYQWWLGNYEGDEFFQAQGIMGQYIIVIPNQKLVIVRTGKDRSKERIGNLPADLYAYIKIAKRLTK